MTIVPLGPADAPAYVAHMQRHARENGADGDPLFMPYGKEHSFGLDDAGKRRSDWWSAPVGAVEWGRCWGLRAPDGDRVVGHVELRVSPPPTASHRAGMGMGLERPVRGQGHGAALLRTALDWARAEPSLRWIDLGVFAVNVPAVRLYERFGFTEIGRMPERFIVDGVAVEDISMTLYVGPPR